MSGHRSTPHQTELTDFGNKASGEQTGDSSSNQSESADDDTRSPLGPISPTGIADCATAAEIDGIHLLGVLHRHPLDIARLTGAVTRYEPDIVAVEACKGAIMQYHPDNYDPRWPPEHEVEAAAFLTDHEDNLTIAGIDSPSSDWSDEKKKRFARIDAEIFVELGIIESPDDLTKADYYELDLPSIRKWREHTKERVPEAFKEVLTVREEKMAGHLFALHAHEATDTIVVAIGVQHLTGVIDLLQTPSKIPDDRIEIPPFSHYHTT